jgi:hypothetical protein
VAAIDLFMEAERIQESGDNYLAYNPSSGASGAYQFTQGTWVSALGMAGLGGSVYAREQAYQAPASVQDAAARALMSSYYSQFGNSWFNVAEAWYGGPGAVGNPSIGGGPGYPNVGQYAADVIAIYNGLGGVTVATVPTGIPTLTEPFTTQFGADVGEHYTNIIAPPLATWTSATAYTLSNLVSIPTKLA